MTCAILTQQKEALISQEYLKSLHSYDETTGIFTRKITRNNKTPAGTISGSAALVNGKSYRTIWIDSHTYKEHRLAWLYVHGKFPVEQIDHIDGNGLNNRIANLREVTNEENNKNIKLYSNNSSGIAGVRWYEYKTAGRWLSRISLNGKRVHLGYFSNFNDAVIARRMAEYEFGYHPNHGSDRPL